MKKKNYLYIGEKKSNTPENPVDQLVQLRVVHTFS